MAKEGTVVICIDDSIINLMQRVNIPHVLLSSSFLLSVESTLSRFIPQKQILDTDTENINIKIETQDEFLEFNLKVNPLSAYEKTIKNEASMKKLFDLVVVFDDGLRDFISNNSLGYIDIMSAIEVGNN